MISNNPARAALSRAINRAIAEGAPVFVEMPYWERPCASAPFQSFRYRGPFGWIMVAGRDTADALKQAARSTDSPIDAGKLEAWDGAAYVPAAALAMAPAHWQAMALALGWIEGAGELVHADLERARPAGDWRGAVLDLALEPSDFHELACSTMAPPPPVFTCKRCEARNPLVYFAPVPISAAATMCTCFACADAAGFLTRDGDLKPGFSL